MTVRKVLRMGDPLLSQTSEAVTKFDTAELHNLILDMRDTMKAEDGAGLAAPQIGMPLRVVIFGIESNPRYEDEPVLEETILINPVITFTTDELIGYWEGCLSVPGMRGLVPRPRTIHYSGFDQYGKAFERDADEFHARVVQHEVDHLDGILYPARIEDMSQFGYIEELEASMKSEDS